MAVSASDRAVRLIDSMGVARPRELEAHGVSRAQLARLVDSGLILRQGRGLYVSVHHAPSEAHSLVQVAKRAPEAVFCLLTALRFHNLTTQSPADVWIALSEKARRPRLDHPRLRVARFSGAALTQGIEQHRAEGVLIHVYSAAKTVADCFKYRNKVGVDVAVEALRDFSRRHRGGANELARFARICRVSRVMQPYLDAIA
jgi:predicted transcriptional regulator of viral defense system